MPSSLKIIGVGNPIVDYIARIQDNFLEQIEGEKGGMVLVDATKIEQLFERLPNEPALAPGGSAGNTTFALARLGAQTAYLGKIGNCHTGNYYQNQFEKLGGDTSRFKIGNIPNGRCLSLVTPDSERTMRTDLGAAMTLSPEEITPQDFTGCHHAHIEGYLLFNEALMRSVLESAKTAGCTISLDLASFEVVNVAKSILPEILDQYVDLVFANEDEATAYTGLTNDYAAMATELAQLCDIAAVKVGTDGCYVAQQQEIYQVDAVHAPNVIDTTAAGDLWNAGFLYGWSQKLDLPNAAHFGSLLGAAVVQEQGSVLPENVWNKILTEIA